MTCCGTRSRRTGSPAALNGLLPTHPQYAALKAALEITPATETAKIGRIRLNMDRWRWLPRDLGPKYVIVNVPGFHATLVENGVNRWKHKAIAGATKTPDAATVGDGGRSDAQSFVGSAPQHHP